MHTGKFPRAAELIASANEEALAFRNFSLQHRCKLWSPKLHACVNGRTARVLGSAVIKRRNWVVGLFPNDAAITLLVRAVLLEQASHIQLGGLRILLLGSMVAISQVAEELPAAELFPAANSYRRSHP